MPAEVKKTARRKLRTVPIQMLFPCADVLIDNSGLVASMTELSRRVIFRVVPLEEVMLVFPGVDQEKLVILLQKACLNVRLEAKRSLFMSSQESMMDCMTFCSSESSVM